MAEQVTPNPEQQRLLDEETQVLAELRHLREAMLAEVDIDPEEGDAEITERKECCAVNGIGKQAARYSNRPTIN
ncbi:MAG: hypothetical protein R2867_33115 [Caldilineaceae bacterium]